MNKATQAATLIENSVNIETVDAVSSNYAYTQTLVQAGNVLNDPMYFNTELIDMLEIYIDDPDYENIDGYEEVSNIVSAAQDFNDSVEDMQSLYADFNAELSVLVGNATSSSASLITLLKEEIAAMITTVNDLK